MQKLKISAKISAKTLLVLGRQDRVIPIERGREFVHSFEDVKVCEHDGAHWLPVDAEFRDVLDAFVDSLVKQCAL